MPGGEAAVARRSSGVNLVSTGEESARNTMMPAGIQSRQVLRVSRRSLPRRSRRPSRPALPDQLDEDLLEGHLVGREAAQTKTGGGDRGGSARSAVGRSFTVRRSVAPLRSIRAIHGRPATAVTSRPGLDFDQQPLAAAVAAFQIVDRVVGHDTALVEHRNVSQTRSTSARMWVENNTVVRPAKAATMSRTSLRPIGSRALVGSSSSRRRGRSSAPGRRRVAASCPARRCPRAP